MGHADSGASFDGCTDRTCSDNEWPAPASDWHACDVAADSELTLGASPLQDARPEMACRLPISHLNRAVEPTPVRRDGADIPFVVQHGRNLFFLTWEAGRWTLAELEFDAVEICFVEQRRSQFEWPREAFGVLLSRFAAMDRVETEILQRTSDDFARWLAGQFRDVSHSA